MAESPPPGTKIDIWSPLVKAFLNKKFGEAKATTFCTLLQEAGGLIAGGSVLSACLGETTPGQDIDIYVPVEKIPLMLNVMITSVTAEPLFPAEKWNAISASFYCKSFLRKNGIRKIYSFERAEAGEKVNIDIMSVRNKRTPLKVVNNFDLTFCQVWFDGKDVYASHPEHIRTKSGVLQYDYCLTLLSGNRFLKNRIRKYTARGFKINFDERLMSQDYFQNIFDSIATSQTSSVCATPDNVSFYKYDDPEYALKWYNRIALRWALGIRDVLDEDNKPALQLPMDINNNECPYTDKPYDSKASKSFRYRKNNIRSFKITDLDGYDSDDMNSDKMRRTILTYYPVNPDEGETSDDLKVFRTYTNLVSNLYKNIPAPPRRYAGEQPYTFNLAIEQFLLRPKSKDLKFKAKKAEKLINIITEKSLRTGDDIFGGEGKLYDIHYHDIGGGVTQESLETYLGGKMNSDIYDVPCYYEGAGCTKKLTLREIKGLVSREFYKKYSAPRPVKNGLNLEVDNYGLIFRNIKTEDPDWGNIYHATMCPYCLKFEERGHGCSVMTHENPKGLENNEAPYCPTGRAVPELITKYKEAAARLNEGYTRLEFCVTCGRPSNGHQHFDLTLTAMLDTPKIPDPRHPGEEKYDYGACPGGGRPEMLARMLAVRDIYRRRDLRDTTEERKQAALAADAAPKNPELMARAEALWAAAQPGLIWLEAQKAAGDAAAAAAATAGQNAVQQRDAGIAARTAYATANPKPADVSWDIAAPKTKAYNDPLYTASNAVNNVDYTDWLNGPAPVPAPAPAAAPAGGGSIKKRLSLKRRRGKTPKKTRNTRNNR
jgi:hypothetical protein